MRGRREAADRLLQLENELGLELKSGEGDKAGIAGFWDRERGSWSRKASERYNLAPSSLSQRSKAEKALKEQTPAWEFRSTHAERAIPQFLPNGDFYCLRNVRTSSVR